MARRLSFAREEHGCGEQAGGRLDTGVVAKIRDDGGEGLRRGLADELLLEVVVHGGDQSARSAFVRAWMSRVTSWKSMVLS